MIGAVLGFQGPASADIYLELSDNSGGTTGVLTNAGTAISFTGVVGNFNVGFTAADTVSSTGLATLQITNLTVSLISGATLVGSGDTITVQTAATNLTLPPVTPLTLGSSGGATFTSSSRTDTMSFQSFLDPNNAASGFPASFGVGTGTAGFTLTSPGGTTPVSVSGNDTPVADISRGSLYALSNITTVTITALGLGTSVDTGGSTTATPQENSTSIVPEPSSFAIAGLGALGMIGYGLRRRKAQGA